MRSFKVRSTQKELLDADGIPKEALWRNLYELEVINKQLGGHQLTIAALETVMRSRPKGTWRIIDLGCGGGDTLRAVEKAFLKSDCQLEMVGVDILPDAVEYAERNTHTKNVKYICGSFESIELADFDIAMSSLFCHHLYGADFNKLIATKRRLARYTLINDLQRHPAAYFSIKWLTSLFSKSYLVKNDAPLSVSRGFSRKELTQMLGAFEWKDISIKWGWAFRWIVIGERNEDE